MMRYEIRERDGHLGMSEVCMKRLQNTWNNPGLYANYQKAITETNDSLRRLHMPVLRDIMERALGAQIGSVTGSGACGVEVGPNHRDFLAGLHLASDCDICAVVPAEGDRNEHATGILDKVVALVGDFEGAYGNANVKCWVVSRNHIVIKIYFRCDCMPGLVPSNATTDITVDISLRDEGSDRFAPVELKPREGLIYKKFAESQGSCDREVVFAPEKRAQGIQAVYREIFADENMRWMMWFLRAMSTERVPSFAFAMMVGFAGSLTQEAFTSGAVDLNSPRFFVLYEALNYAINVVMNPDRLETSWDLRGKATEITVPNHSAFCGLNGYERLQGFLQRNYGESDVHLLKHMCSESQWIELESWYDAGSYNKLVGEKIAFKITDLEVPGMCFAVSYRFMKIVAAFAVLVDSVGDAAYKEMFMRYVVNKGVMIDIVSTMSSVGPLTQKELFLVKSDSVVPGSRIHLASGNCCEDIQHIYPHRVFYWLHDINKNSDYLRSISGCNIKAIGINVELLRGLHVNRASVFTDDNTVFEHEFDETVRYITWGVSKIYPKYDGRKVASRARKERSRHRQQRSDSIESLDSHLSDATFSDSSSYSGSSYSGSSYSSHRTPPYNHPPPPSNHPYPGQWVFVPSFVPMPQSPGADPRRG